MLLGRGPDALPKQLFGERVTYGFSGPRTNDCNLTMTLSSPRWKGSVDQLTGLCRARQHETIVLQGNPRPRQQYPKVGTMHHACLRRGGRLHRRDRLRQALQAVAAGDQHVRAPLGTSARLERRDPSRGTARPTRPTSVSTVFGVVPLRGSASRARPDRPAPNHHTLDSAVP